MKKIRYHLPTARRYTEVFPFSFTFLSALVCRYILEGDWIKSLIIQFLLISLIFILNSIMIEKVRWQLYPNMMESIPEYNVKRKAYSGVLFSLILLLSFKVIIDPQYIIGSLTLYLYYPLAAILFIKIGTFNYRMKEYPMLHWRNWGKHHIFLLSNHESSRAGLILSINRFVYVILVLFTLVRFALLLVNDWVFTSKLYLNELFFEFLLLSFSMNFVLQQIVIDTSSIPTYRKYVIIENKLPILLIALIPAILHLAFYPHIESIFMFGLSALLIPFLPGLTQLIITIPFMLFVYPIAISLATGLLVSLASLNKVQDN